MDIKEHQTNAVLDRVDSIEQLLSPAEEHVGIFSRIEEKETTELTNHVDEKEDDATRVKSKMEYSPRWFQMVFCRTGLFWTVTLEFRCSMPMQIPKFVRHWCLVDLQMKKGI